MVEKLRNEIKFLVGLNNGVSETSLSIKLMNNLGPFKFSTKQYRLALDLLVKENELIEFKFTDPGSTRVKSLLFMKGTQFVKEINGDGERMDNQSFRDAKNSLIKSKSRC
jgi:hypothetical protein